MSSTDRGYSGSGPALVVLIFAIVLIVPLLDLPRPSTVTGLPWKVELLASVGLLAAVFFFRSDLAALGTHKPVRNTFILIAAFTGWSLLSAAWAQFALLTLHHTFLWGVYASVFLAVAALTRRPVGERLIVNCLAAVAGLLGIICLIDFASLVDFAASEGTLRIRWAKYAELLVTISPLILAASSVDTEKRRRNLLLLSSALGWVAAQFSLSKAAFISGIVGFSVFFVLLIARGARRQRQTILIQAAVWICLTASVQIAFTYFTSIPSTTQYITGSADVSRETSSMRVFTWKVTSAMIAHHPVLGVGADNFGAEFNDARRIYARSAPNDPDNAIGEDYLFERAHNEYLQVFAELGVIGVGLLASLFLYVAFLFLKFAMRGGLTLQAAGAVGGLAAFAVSSLFTSFSFRAAQNGIVFFVVLGVLVSTSGSSAEDQTAPQGPGVPRGRNTLPAFVVLTAVCLFAFSALKAAGYVLLTSADREADRALAAKRMELAIAVDPEPATASFSLSYTLAKQGDQKRAAELMRNAIDKGIGISVAYTRLSELHREAGDVDAAQAALREGIEVFPRSVYLRVRLALLLEELGSDSESKLQLEAARAISPRDAIGWENLIRYRSVRAHYMATADPTATPPAALKPGSGIYQYLDDSIPAAEPSK